MRLRKTKPPLIRRLHDNVWYCTYGVHAFESDKRSIKDCPERHALRTELIDIFENNSSLKREFLSRYPKGVNSLTNKQAVIVLQLVASALEDERKEIDWNEQL